MSRSYVPWSPCETCGTERPSHCYQGRECVPCFTLGHIHAAIASLPPDDPHWKAVDAALVTAHLLVCTRPLPAALHYTDPFLSATAAAPKQPGPYLLAVRGHSSTSSPLPGPGQIAKKPPLATRREGELRTHHSLPRLQRRGPGGTHPLSRLQSVARAMPFPLPSSCRSASHQGGPS